jgi:hypothetical protein
MKCRICGEKKEIFKKVKKKLKIIVDIKIYLW